MSFVSVDPQSRVVLESHSHSLLAQFDTQLGIIEYRYLAFFQERRRIEAKYIESLRKLHRKTKAVDATYDPRAEPTTTRLAWDKVTDILEREANTQQYFVDVLDNDVIKPLRTWKESTVETRMRVEEDLKESAAQYADHVENKFLKLQEAYFKQHHPQQYCPEDVRNKGFGGKVSALFRPRRDSEPSEEVSDDECRRVVGRLNSLRLMRAESLGDGYDCLEGLIFTPTVKDVIVKYKDGMVKSCAKYDELVKSAGEDVEQALRGTDSSDLSASFRRALSFSIPPPTVYCNLCSDAYSKLIFGIPLVDLTTEEDNIPKVVRMCIEEVEKRGLNTKRIYSEGSVYDAEVLELRRRFESETICSFSATHNIHSVATLLKRYLWDLPEPLFTLHLEDYRNYKQNRASYTENDCSLFRSKISELHPVHRASLGALLQHLLRVSSHSDTNSMTVEALAYQFRYAVLRGGAVVQDGVHVKGLVLEDLIQNAHTLFDERPSPSPPITSSYVAEATSTNTYSSLSLTPESPQSAQVQAGSTIRHRPWLVDGIPTSRSTQPSFPSFPSDTAMEIRLASSPTSYLSPLLGFPSPRPLMGGTETTTQGQAISEGRDTEVETLANGIPAEVVPAVPLTRTYVTEWRSRYSRPLPQPEAVTMQGPPESVSSSSSGIPPSSATSLQTRLGRFSH